MVIGHHMMLTGYGHWLPNDPRGSMSLDVYSPRLAELAQVHFGRKRRQPSLRELREFYEKAAPLLAYPVLWFDSAKRQAIAKVIGSIVGREKLTCYACAVLTNHIHLLIRRHRLKAEEMLGILKRDIRDHLRASGSVPADHPVFSADHRVFFKSDPQAVRNCIGYIRRNFRKHGLPVQEYPFVTPYNDWPFHNRLKRPRS